VAIIQFSLKLTGFGVVVGYTYLYNVLQFLDKKLHISNKDYKRSEFQLCL